LALMRLPGLGTRCRAERRVPDGHTEPVVAVASAYTPARCVRWGSNPLSDVDGLLSPALPMSFVGAAASRDCSPATQLLPAGVRRLRAGSGVRPHRGQRPPLRETAGQTKTPVASADRGSFPNRKAIAGRLPVVGKGVRSLGIGLCAEHAYAQVIPRAQVRCEGQISVWFAVDGHLGTSDQCWRASIGARISVSSKISRIL